MKSGNKLRDFQDTVYVNIVAITETWLTSEISDTELLPWGYEIFRCDRLVSSDGSSRGRGTLLACRSCLRCSPVCLSQNNNGLELSAIELNTNNSGKVLGAVIYRPPKANTTWIRNFTDLFSQITYNRIVVLGDLNLPTITCLDGSGFCDSDDLAILLSMLVRKQPFPTNRLSYL